VQARSPCAANAVRYESIISSGFNQPIFDQPGLRVLVVPDEDHKRGRREMSEASERDEVSDTPECDRGDRCVDAHYCDLVSLERSQ